MRKNVNNDVSKDSPILRTEAKRKQFHFKARNKEAECEGHDVSGVVAVLCVV